MKEKDTGQGLQEAVDNVIERGVKLIEQRNPRFTSQEEFLKNQIDKKRVKDYLSRMPSYLERCKSDRERERLVKGMYDSAKGHIISGDFLTREGKELVLRESFRRKGRIENWAPTYTLLKRY